MSLKRNVLDLRKRKEIVLQGGGEEAIKKQAAMGKLTARERIEAILDKDSFHEYDMFVEHQSKDFDMDKKFFMVTVSLSVPEQFMENPYVFTRKISPLPVVHWV